MISEETREKLIEILVKRIQDANISILKKIGNSLDEMSTLNATQAQKLIQILKYGTNYQDIIKELQKATSLNAKDIDKILNEVAKKDLDFAKRFYEYRNIKPIPYEENTALKSLVESIARTTKETYFNLSNTSVIGYNLLDANGNVVFKSIGDAYKYILDEAVLNVGTGKETFDAMMKKQLKQLGGSGLRTIDYESTYVDKFGNVKHRTRRLDSALRMNMQGALRDLHNKQQEMLGEEYGADGIEISVHENPAIDHQKAQGRQFTKENYTLLNEGYEVEDYTGEKVTLRKRNKRGDEANNIRPISQLNCYHYEFSIILGISKPRYSKQQLRDIIKRNNDGFMLDGKKYTMYQGTQLQRNLETQIRKMKDIQILAREENNKDLIIECQSNINNLKNRYNELCQASGLNPKKDRISVSQYRHIRYKQV